MHGMSASSQHSSIGEQAFPLRVTEYSNPHTPHTSGMQTRRKIPEPVLLADLIIFSSCVSTAHSTSAELGLWRPA